MSCKALTGYALEEITPDLWATRTLVEDQAAIADAMVEAVFAQRPITVEYRRHRDGSCCRRCNTARRC
ncbi:MAG TPA: PAS domain-containing protein [Nodosilinea sp.]|nr:PAS domain-containing protein [Nodosilinea sp.]